MREQRILGVDLGGTGIKLGAVAAADTPRILSRDLITNFDDRDPESVLDDVASRLHELVRTAGWPEADAVGVGSAGLVRSSGTVVFSPNLPRWSGTDLVHGLSKRLGLPVSFDNDVNAFALAEWKWGAGSGSADVVFLTLGTGIGGALVSGGRLLHGHDGFAGEPGHTTLVFDGIACPCGNHGCAERYVGRGGIIDAARASGLNDDSGGEVLSPETLSRLAVEGNTTAQAVLAEVGGKLGGLLVSLVNLVNPERVVVGGGIAQAGEFLLAPARSHLLEHSLVARHSPPQVLAAALGESAGVLGAAALALGTEDLP